MGVALCLFLGMCVLSIRFTRCHHVWPHDPKLLEQDLFLLSSLFLFSPIPTCYTVNIASSLQVLESH